MPETFNPIITHLYSGQGGASNEVTKYNNATISGINVDNVKYDFGKILNETIGAPFNIDRTSGTLSGWDKTTPRDFEASKYYAGLTMDGYYNGNRISNVSISQGTISFDTFGGGYGVAFPVRVTPGQTYIAETNSTVGNEIAISWYDDSGNIISYDFNHSYNIVGTAPTDAYWGVVVLRGDGGTHTFEDVMFRYLHRTIKQPVDSVEFYGNTIKLNQISPSVTNYTATASYGTVTYQDGKLIYEITSSPNNNANFTPTGNFARIRPVYGHQYLMRVKMSSTEASPGVSFLWGNISQKSIGALSANEVTTLTKFFTATSDTQHNYNLYIYPCLARNITIGTVITLYSVELFDLTDIYGAGNEPSTVAEFTKTFKKSYYPNNPGELVSIYRAFTSIDGESGSGKPTQLIRCYGINLWDEEWELGYFSASDGRKATSNDRIKCKNKIMVIPDTDYYFSCVKSNAGFVLLFYDAEDNYLGLSSASVNPNISELLFTTPTSACYMRFYMDIPYGVTYLNDICINISDPSINGTYYPYRKYSKLNGINDVKDTLSILPNWGEVDLGTLEWSYDRTYFVFNALLSNAVPATFNLICSKYEKSNIQTSIAPDKTIFIRSTKYIGIKDSSYTDAATFKAAMSGVMLYFELKTGTQPPSYIALYMKSIGMADMGMLNWTYNSSNGVFYTSDIAQYLPSVSDSVKANILTSKYTTVKANENADSSGIDKSISQGDTFVQKGINVKDSSYTDATTFKNAMSGTVLYYEQSEKQIVRLSQQEVEYVLNGAYTYTPYSILARGNENELEQAVDIGVWGQR